jgi:hypothetical protein
MATYHAFSTIPSLMLRSRSRPGSRPITIYMAPGWVGPFSIDKKPGARTETVTIMSWLEPAPRHQCLIYEGAPSRHLPALAAVMLLKLQQNYRCLYLNSLPMVAGMRSYLAAAGVDVAHEVGKASLVLLSDQWHLAGGRFDVERMMHTLEDGLHQALGDGYKGLWATGDMTWEMGPQKDYSKLLEYERRLEKCFREHPE